MIGQMKKKLLEMFPCKPKKPIEDWDFIMAFDEEYKQEISTIMDSLKCKEDVEWAVADHKEDKKTLFVLKMSDQVVQDMAHELKILKKKDKRSFKLELKDINEVIYAMSGSQATNAYKYMCYIRSRMYPSNKEICEQEKYSAFNKNKIKQYSEQKNGQLFNEEEKLRAKYHFLLTYKEQIPNSSKKEFQESFREPFAQLMKHPGFEELLPIHKSSQYSPFIFTSLKDYLGPNIECYFDFVNFFQKWLIFPLIFGIITVAINSYYSYTAENSPVDFLYAWAVMIWSVLFITRWEEIQEWTRIKESPGRSELWSEHQQLISKRGMEKKISPVTGQAEHILPLKQRIMLQIASNTVFLSITIITMVFMVLSLNLRGFIDPEHKLFYSEKLSSLAAPGGIFDANTNWGQIPNILHVLITNAFDEMVYRPLAKKLSKFERHKSIKGYENSIIIKYFVYEFLITFADLFYIAFVRLDIEGLREQLFALFFIDIIRRVVAESFIPWLKTVHRFRTLGKSYGQKEITYDKELQIGAILQIDKEPYEQFDDYLQIITNFGYLVMISSCFPIAPVMMLIAHQVQILQDRYKVVHIFKRKLPQSYVGMGRWKQIIVFLCYVSIITNIMLFAFSSGQVASVFPKLFEGGKDLLYGNIDLQSLFGGAAVGLFQAMIELGNVTEGNRTSFSDGWDMMDFIETNPVKNNSGAGLLGNLGGLGDLSAQGTSDSSAKLDSIPKTIPLTGLGKPKAENSVESKGADPFIKANPLGGLVDQAPKEKVEPIPIADIFGLNPQPSEKKSESFGKNSIQSKAPKKQSEVTFIALLFFIEHFFLILFNSIRGILKRRKSEADIFLERRQYKRKIKKNLPKDIIPLLTGGMLINKIFKKIDEDKGQNLIGSLFGKKPQSEENKEQGSPTQADLIFQEPSLTKKNVSEMSGDTVLIERNGQDREKQNVRQMLLHSVERMNLQETQ